MDMKYMSKNEQDEPTVSVKQPPLYFREDRGTCRVLYLMNPVDKSVQARKMGRDAHLGAVEL